MKSNFEYVGTAKLIQFGDGTKGFTIGAFEKQVDGKGPLRPITEWNNKDDIWAVKEHCDPDLRYWSKPDLDLVIHPVSPPREHTMEWLVSILENRASNYQWKEKSETNVLFDRCDANCATFVNSVFATADIPAKTRLKLGEFAGWDWGEEDMLDRNLFYSP